MEPLTPEEQQVIDKVYQRFQCLDKSHKEKSNVLQKFIGPREFHCQGESTLSQEAFDEMELRANERIYLLLR